MLAPFPLIPIVAVKRRSTRVDHGLSSPAGGCTGAAVAAVAEHLDEPQVVRVGELQDTLERGDALAGDVWAAASSMAQRLWLTTSTLCPSGSRTKAP